MPPLGFISSPVRFYLHCSPIIRHFISLKLPLETCLAPRQLANLIYFFIIFFYFTEASVPLADKCTILPRKFFFFLRKKKKQRVIDVIPRKRNLHPFQLQALQVKGKKKKSFKNLLPFWGLKHQKTSLSRLGQSALGPGSYNIELKADSSHKRLALLPLKSDPFCLSLAVSRPNSDVFRYQRPKACHSSTCLARDRWIVYDSESRQGHRRRESSRETARDRHRELWSNWIQWTKCCCWQEFSWWASSALF